MPSLPKNFSLLIKPASSLCNLGCRYCFYHPETLGLPTGRMTDATLREMISSYLATEQGEYIFCWQGGEPTLMGVEFFQRVIELQQLFARPGSIIGNALQTNAVAIDDRLAALFARYRFLVGVSLDGPEHLHDQNRCHKNGAPTYREVMHGLDRLRRAGVACNVLTVITKQTAPAIGEIFSHHQRLGLIFQQYIPCLETSQDGEDSGFSLDGAAWGEALCRLSDLWLAHDPGKISIRLFDAILSRLVHGRSTQCSMADDCRQYLVVEHDGAVYPCDFNVTPGWRLGDFRDTDWDEIRRSSAYQRFGQSKQDCDATCRACDFFMLCQGDCPKMRDLDGGQNGPSRLCQGWRRFFTHSLPVFEEMAEAIRTAR